MPIPIPYAEFSRKLVFGHQCAPFAPALFRYITTRAIVLRAACGPCVTMVPKRKEPTPTMALMKEDITPEYHSTPEGRVDAAPRRSSRKIKKSGVAMRHNIDDAEKERLASKGIRTRGKKETAETREGVKIAMDGLREMEENLRESVKRQKLALNRSSVMSSAAETVPEQAAFLPRPTKSSTKSLPPTKLESNPEKLPAPHRLDMPQIFPEDDAPEMPDVAGDDATEDFYAAKQEGARPPPVNSEFLPLPWKGRLGYVNTSPFLSLFSTI
jgi:UV DNA damage endonuclease